MPWWWIAVVGIILGAAGYQFWRSYQQKRWDDQQPLHSLKVRVSSRESKSSLPPRQRDDQHREDRRRYYVEFTPLEGGEPRSFEVKREQYKRLEEGLEGTLTLQGSRLVSFKSLD